MNTYHNEPPDLYDEAQAEINRMKKHIADQDKIINELFNAIRKQTEKLNRLSKIVENYIGATKENNNE